MQLNEPQREAVYHTTGPLLILAGAGSGKTRVITERINRLINEEKVSASSICAVTFTNKAAEEMKERLRSLTGKRIKGLYVGTFHSLGLKILRENVDQLPLEENFTILNQEDQYAIAAEIQKETGIDPEVLPEKTMIWNFSQAKNTGLPAKEISYYLSGKLGSEWEEYFGRYQEYLGHINSVDFDDLLLLPRDLLKSNESVRNKYREKWKYFLVDEFQDTNPLQFDFLRQLIDESNNLCAVGDDDQSIYGWRGADIRIILGFRETYDNARIVYLEQNYRSTQTILDLANSTIQNNTNRHSKKLWSAKGRGEPVEIAETETSEDEAVFLADSIAYLQQTQKQPLSDMAILFRTNFQSRPFEEELRRRNIPYHLSGGYQFFDRKEIKDLIAYLRFIANHADERSFMRIINFPRRQIGDASLQKLRDLALLEKKRIWDILLEIESHDISLPTPAFSGLLEFRDFIQRHEAALRRPGNLSRAFTALVEDLNPEQEFARMGLEENKVQARMYNIKELFNSVYYFESQNQGEKAGLFEYLQYISLLTTDRDEDQQTDKLQLMTLHLAKGLEFRTVFLTGMEDGILPHRRSLEESEETLSGHSLEEERRLFYVGITRAKEKLFLSYARMRRSYGEEMETQPSRFLMELPESLVIWNSRGEEEKSVEEMLNLIDSF